MLFKKSLVVAVEKIICPLQLFKAICISSLLPDNGKASTSSRINKSKNGDYLIIPFEENGVLNGKLKLIWKSKIL